MTPIGDAATCEALRWLYAASRSGAPLEIVLVALTAAFVVAGWRLVAAAVRHLPRPAPRRSRA